MRITEAGHLKQQFAETVHDVFDTQFAYLQLREYQNNGRVSRLNFFEMEVYNKDNGRNERVRLWWHDSQLTMALNGIIRNSYDFDRERIVNTLEFYLRHHTKHFRNASVLWYRTFRADCECINSVETKTE